MRLLFLTVLFLLAAPASYGQDTIEHCQAAGAREFDFWLGDWNIEQAFIDADGEILRFPAETSVTLAAGGCALVERWKGTVRFPWEQMAEPAPLEAVSIRYFNPTDGNWYIHWLDSRRPYFGAPFVGRFSRDGGSFLRKSETPNGPRTARIRFVRESDSVVLWTLSIGDGAEGWQDIWRMRMTRKPAT